MKTGLQNYSSKCKSEPDTGSFPYQKAKILATTKALQTV